MIHIPEQANAEFMNLVAFPDSLVYDVATERQLPLVFGEVSHASQVIHPPYCKPLKRFGVFSFSSVIS
jgi:hypothetical protein